MIEKTFVIDAIFDCVGELNKQLPPDQQFVKAPDSVLVGEGGVLDSLGLITLFVSVELELQNRFSIACSLLDMLMEDQSGSHFRTIATMAAWISETARTA